MMKRKDRFIMLNMYDFLQEINFLIKSPIFIILTLFGNALIGCFSLLFFIVEKGKNPMVHNFLDALWWAMSTATTTGFGDITPTTVMGKIIGIILMLIGMALFSMFTALFAEMILTQTKFNKPNNK